MASNLVKRAEEVIKQISEIDFGIKKGDKQERLLCIIAKSTLISEAFKLVEALKKRPVSEEGVIEVTRKLEDMV